MNIISRIISVIMSVVCAVTSFFGVPDAEEPIAKQYAIYGSGSCETANGRVAVHDPSIVRDKNGVYYILGTHGCAAKSNDMIKWQSVFERLSKRSISRGANLSATHRPRMY